MKRMLWAVAAAGLAAAPAWPQAGAGSGRAGGVQLGWFQPLGGDLNDGAKGSIGFGGHFFQTLTPDWTGVAELDLVQWTSKESSPGVEVEFRSTILGLSARRAFAAGRQGVQPYGLFGLQFASNRAEVSGTFAGTPFESSETETRIGIQAGLGLDVPFDDAWTWGGDLRYRTFGSDGSAFSVGFRATRAFGV